MGRGRLTEEEAGALLAERSSAWVLQEHRWIVRKYRFGAFKDSIAFVNGVAEAAEALDHHPLIAVDYKLVTLRLTSWHAGGLTLLDFTAAARFDEAYRPWEKAPAGGATEQ
ncbi:MULTISPECIES: 4a-hydroxytetrahydrobiopterin dehydratase [Paenibacillus]|uniref:4a-hydroxytetrahydrobiopterin dehydratase n=1 Tax=Paenibacillus TaxID=44249 RepID=UPI0022B8C8C8|nr:4a-hydroxytetrahydrobiopterin dehydratase [Paenibacillus caseinilyticus]MCZ8522933.1 4a-hydroxytetrahydrobiopterin dehydratase [Paenibacillus caseinilyticus]